MSESLEEAIEDIRISVCSKPKAVITLGKEFLAKQREMGVTTALEEGGKVMVGNLELKDAQEGMKAFKEKRRPVWSHTDEKV